MRTKYFIPTIILFSCIIFTGLTSCKEKKKTNPDETQTAKKLYTCSMHPQIIKDAPGDCPICGMHLIEKTNGNNSIADVDLNTLLQPTNNFVVSAVPLAAMQLQDIPIVINALGSVAYDTRAEGTIAAKFSGRIEKLYVRYRYQQIKKGQKIMDIYSPEILTAQQNLLFLLKNDEQNISLIDAAKQRLLLLGIDEMQLEKIIQTKKALLTVSVYSNYTGHIHEAGNFRMNTVVTGMKDISTLTEELQLKEGMYVKKGETVFSVYDPSKAWILLSIFGNDESLIKPGDEVIITPETLHGKSFKAHINFIEPFYRKDSKTVTARVYFDNAALQIPIGSQVKSVINTKIKKAFWLPNASVLSLGLDKIVFLKEEEGFRAHKIETGIAVNDKIQITGGLTVQDSVAANAQYLMDSESFIKIKN